MNKNTKEMLEHIIMGSVLITVNLFFLIFVHNKYDLAPNFVLALITLPLAIREITKAFMKARSDEI